MEVERLAGALAALGVGPGDTVALLLRNSPEFTLLDTAAMHLGAVPWSVYPMSSPEQVRFMLAGAGIRVLVGERDLLDRAGDLTEGTPVEAAAEVTVANARLSRAEQVRRRQVMDADWVADSDELTPTMKLRRARVAKRYAALVDRLYTW